MVALTPSTESAPFLISSACLATWPYVEDLIKVSSSSKSMMNSRSIASEYSYSRTYI